MSKNNTVEKTTSKPEHREKSLITLPSFARKKKVALPSLRYQVFEKGNIKYIQIGVDKDVYIDWNEYKDFKFDKTKNQYK